LTSSREIEEERPEVDWESEGNGRGCGGKLQKKISLI
jgi:hypothetical protein